MRRGLILLAVLGASGAAGAQAQALPDAGVAHSASCRPPVVRGGIVYDRSRVSEGNLPRRTKRLHAFHTNCGGPPYQKIWRFPVFRLRGVPVAVALERARRRRIDILLARGFFTTLPSHPLYARFHRRGPARSDYRDECHVPVHITGEAFITQYDRVYLDRQGRFAAVDSFTAVDTPRRSGLPYVRTGSMVRIEGMACAEGSAMVADRISEAPTR